MGRYTVCPYLFPVDSWAKTEVECAHHGGSLGGCPIAEILFAYIEEHSNFRQSRGTAAFAEETMLRRAAKPGELLQMQATKDDTNLKAAMRAGPQLTYNRV